MKIFVRVNGTNTVLEIQLHQNDTIFDLVEKIQQTSDEIDYDFGLQFQGVNLVEHDLVNLTLDFDFSNRFRKVCYIPKV